MVKPKMKLNFISILFVFCTFCETEIVKYEKCQRFIAQNLFDIEEKSFVCDSMSMSDVNGNLSLIAAMVR